MNILYVAVIKQLLFIYSFLLFSLRKMFLISCEFYSETNHVAVSLEWYLRASEILLSNPVMELSC